MYATSPKANLKTLLVISENPVISEIPVILLIKSKFDHDQDFFDQSRFYDVLIFHLF
jgi:hypothetical protein